MKNSVFIAMSLDGYIADQNNDLDWLINFPNEDEIDYGYDAFNLDVDCILMGRKSYDYVSKLDEWLYDKPVFVLSNSLTSILERLQDKAEIINGDLEEVIETIHQKGYTSIYIDGGQVIQQMLRKNLIDEMIITIIPIILGAGFPLFGEVGRKIDLNLLSSITFNNGLVQHHYRIK